MLINDQADELPIRVASARIDRIEQTVQSWREALAGTQAFVTLDLGGIETADVTFLQALLAFRRSLEEQGRHLLIGPLPPGHAVLETGRLLGIPLEHHFTMVGAEP